MYKGTGPVLSATFNSDGTFATTCEIKVEKFPFNTAECYWDIGLARDNNMFLSFGGGILMADDPRANIGFPSSKFIPPTSIWQLEQTPYPFNLSSVPDLSGTILFAFHISTYPDTCCYHFCGIYITTRLGRSG